MDRAYGLIALLNQTRQCCRVTLSLTRPTNYKALNIMAMTQEQENEIKFWVSFLTPDYIFLEFLLFLKTSGCSVPDRATFLAESMASCITA